MGSVDVTVETEIGRPVDVVAAFAGDPMNAVDAFAGDPMNAVDRNVNIKSVNWKTPGPVELGSRMEFVAQFFGRRLTYT
jgi:hypothetical protein